MAAQLRRNAYVLDLLTEALLQEVHAGLEGFGLLLGSFFLLLGRKVEVVGQNVAELMLGVGIERLRNERVDLLRHEQHVEATLAQQLGLRKLRKARCAVAGGKVNVLLGFGHGVAVFLERDVLPLFVGTELHEILQQVLVHAVVRNEAKLQLAAEGGIECLIFLTVVLQHALQLGSLVCCSISRLMFRLRSCVSTTPRTKRKCSGSRSAQFSMMSTPEE